MVGLSHAEFREAAIPREGTYRGNVTSHTEDAVALSRTYHAVISGGLGQGNLGDEALLRAFLERHRADYRSTLILKAGSGDGGLPSATALSLPRLAIGRRFWWGASDRAKKRRLVLAHTASGPREYVWLGGLLAHILDHNLVRYQELLWARTVCSRFLYYFVDIGDGFTETPVASKLVRLLNSIDARLAVRSAEAAEILEEAGLRTKVHVGLDPVLYDRVVRWGIPFVRRSAITDTLAIVPCNYRPDIYQPVWLAAADAGIRLGLRLRWVSLCDCADLPLCLRLAAQVRTQHPNHPQEVCGGVSAEEALAGTACCLATRFHGAIFALTLGVPVLGVPYAPKVSRLFRLLRLQDWLIEPERSGASGLLEGELVERIRGALAGRWRPDYAVLRQQATTHKRALISLGASCPGQIPTAGKPKIPILG